jgi:RNA polymerase sigma factor (sigma-70 family)
MASYQPPPVNRIEKTKEAEILRLTSETKHGSHVIARRAGVSQSTVVRVWRRHKIDRQKLIQRNILVEEHLWLANRIAKSVASGLPLHMRPDLSTVASIALTEAADTFDPARFPGVPFPAYLQRRVRGACIDSIRRRHYLNDNAIGMEQDDIDGRVETAPDAEHLAIESEARYQRRAQAVEMIQQLPGRQAVLLWLHHIEGQTLEAIAPKFGVVASRVSQLHSEAVKILRGMEGK